MNPNLKACAAHLRESNVVPWARAEWNDNGTFPRPKIRGEVDFFDQNGNVIYPISFDTFDSWVKLFPNSQYYCIMIHPVDWSYAGIRGADPAKNPERAKATNPELARRITAVAKLLRERAIKHGIDPSQLVICTVDEPRWGSAARMSTFWNKAVKAGIPECKIFLDPYVKPDYYDNVDVIEMFESADIIVPGTDWNYQWLGQAAVDFYEQWRKKGKLMGFYYCAFNPNSAESIRYYRLQEWACWEIAGGAPQSWSGFWSYGDHRSNYPWNQLLGGMRSPNWTPAYLDTRSATDGKHWLAIFEGVNDYEYLLLLKNRIAELESKNVVALEVTEAKKVLGETPKWVIEQVREKENAKACDEGRLRVLAALRSLNGL